MKRTTMDGNTAASRISYAFSELAVIYPITPSTPMAELADEWATAQKTNLFGNVPKVVEMQSESGVAGAVHGALVAGALTTTYTCSQGLLLMIPDMYKIAGELLPCVFHVCARALATHALSIFGDHQDVMACRQTGFAMLASSSVQETADLAVVAHLATLQSSVPFLHFFDGFRTSHEINKIEVLEKEELQSLLDPNDIAKFRERALTPDRPQARGTAQNPDVYFQNREASNPYYQNAARIVQETMDKLAAVTKRQYRLFDYVGAADAEFVVVMMGSGIGAMEETVEELNRRGEKTGLIKVRLYRPFDVESFIAAIPKTCKKIAVLDRTKESGGIGEPLYLDVCAALSEKNLTDVFVCGGRYGLGGKEFTPTACYAVFKNLKNPNPKNHFTVGISDDVTLTSLDCSEKFSPAASDCVCCKFYGLGSDGTVGANKQTVKLIGEHTNLYAQAYFYYDSRKSGGVTISHLRFGKTPIRSSYKIQTSQFVACHNPSYLTRYDMISDLEDGGVFLLNCPFPTERGLNEHLPPKLKRTIAEKRLRLYAIDATALADEVGLKGRNGVIMQAAFFLLNEGIMLYEKAKELLKAELKKKFERKGSKVVKSNEAAVERTQEALREIHYPESWKQASGDGMQKSPKEPYCEKIVNPILSLRGNILPVSAFNADGSVPTGTTKYEKHGIPYLLPRWIPENCIQCNQCSFVCPHACIRPFVLENGTDKPDSFATIPAVGLKESVFRVQVSPHDCMGCSVCANVCPAKEKALVMHPAREEMPEQGKNWEFSQTVRQADTSAFKRTSVKGSQFSPPLFEFSYACSGCGETSYIKVLTQLFGEKMLIANATGCSSIYGGSSPTCPYTVNGQGKGPAWANSLFEDNAEFGYGMGLAHEVRGEKDKSVWIIGGDGWAYDIGFGGLDHVLASGANVNVLVLDSEVYSNTGGQTSKSTPLSAIARFSTAGKRKPKKNLGLMAMTYGYVYVAQVSMGANKQQLLNALIEAERYDGPSLILAYSPCIAHGVDMSQSQEEEKLAVECGYWQLYRFNPELKKQNKNPFLLDSKRKTEDVRAFLLRENRFASLLKTQPQIAKELFAQMEKDCNARQRLYETFAGLPI